MSEFLKKNRQYVTIATILVIFWASVQFGILPLISLINEKSNLIQEKSLDRENRMKRIQELPKLKEQFNVVSEKEPVFQVLVKKEEALMLIEDIESIAKDSGNKIEIKIQDPAKNDTNSSNAKKDSSKDKDKKVDESLLKPANDNYLAMDISISGTYNSLVAFIQKIENMKYWSDIISIKVSMASPEDQSRSTDIFSSTQLIDTSNVSNNQAKLAAVISAVFYREP
jgi:hypothetical protein